MTSRSKTSPLVGTVVSFLTVTIGLALFVYTVHQVGIKEILEGLQRVGLGFFLILILSGIRELTRTIAWIRSIEPPYHLPLGDALAARTTGEALGNITPLGLLLSEPSKATFVGNLVPPLVAFSALAAEQILYSLSVAILIACGLAVFILSYPLPEGLQIIAMVALSGFVSLALGGAWLIRAEPKVVTGLISKLAKLGLVGSFLESYIEDIRTTEERIFKIYKKKPGLLLELSLLELIFHVAGTAETYITLALLGDSVVPTLTTAFILESVNRAINVIFKFIPFRLGVDEVGTGIVSQVLGYGTTVGVTLAIVRKARVLCWSSLGIVLFIRHKTSIKTLLAKVTSRETRDL